MSRKSDRPLQKSWDTNEWGFGRTGMGKYCQFSFVKRFVEEYIAAQNLFQLSEG